MERNGKNVKIGKDGSALDEKTKQDKTFAKGNIIVCV